MHANGDKIGCRLGQRRDEWKELGGSNRILEILRLRSGSVRQINFEKN